MKLYIIANRLPVKVAKVKGDFVFQRSEGGLATGIDSMNINCEKHWIGWPGMEIDNPDERDSVSRKLEAMNFHPLFLSSEQISNYYEGYSNSTIWPLFHFYFSTFTQYRTQCWQAYREVNEMFCNMIRRIVAPGDVVWVQDYQLMLLPAMLRAKTPGLSIGYFHHIPFPSYELFRTLPERVEILNGLLGSDLIGFHIQDYAAHFKDAAKRILHYDSSIGEINAGGRRVRVEAMPMGINYEMYAGAAKSPETSEKAEKFKESFEGCKIILSVDRLDYSKGILQRLKGFGYFLEKYPEYMGKVVLTNIVVPSRSNVNSYADLKQRIDETIGAINGKYSTIDWTPIRYFNHSFPFGELVAMYRATDIALITPLMDGMNLVAKEYVASKTDADGVLILSEMAGASQEMHDAILINPNDVENIADSIKKAIEMPLEEKITRCARMQRMLAENSVDKWAAKFLSYLDSAHAKNSAILARRMNSEDLKKIRYEYRSAQRRLIMLDYDGTLAAFQARPQDAAPTQKIMSFLEKLSGDSKNHVVINSGRDKETLEKWFGSLPIGLAAEHGAFYKENGRWKNQPQTKTESHIGEFISGLFRHPLAEFKWNSDILELLNRFVEKTPGSSIERKRTAIAWHYRNADERLAQTRLDELESAIRDFCARDGLQVMRGNKVLEIRKPQFNKGSEVSRLLSENRYDFIMSVGDDTTDEDMFKELPKDAVTIKVGNASEYARFNLKMQAEVIPTIEYIEARPSR